MENEKNIHLVTPDSRILWEGRRYDIEGRLQLHKEKLGMEVTVNNWNNTSQWRSSKRSTQQSRDESKCSA